MTTVMVPLCKADCRRASDFLVLVVDVGVDMMDGWLVPLSCVGQIRPFLSISALSSFSTRVDAII